MKRYTLIIIALGFFGTFQLFSQPMNRSTAKVMLNTAVERYDSMDYYNALEWFQKLNDDNKKDQYSTFKIAELQFKLRDYKRAVDWYAKGFRRDKKNEYAEEKFTYARALKMNGQYEDAMVQFSEYIQATQNAIQKTLAEAELKGCQMAPKAPLNERLKVENAGKNINKATSELSPYLSSDGSQLFYASLHSDSAVTLNGKQGDYFLKIYTSKKDGDKWAPGVPLSAQVNREEFHNGNACISRDGRTMYFTRALLTGNIVTESKIYVASMGTDGWGAATEVAGINGTFLSKHPMLGELFGREVLFFTSDMPGGYGGFDIYYANKKSDNAFGDPVNLGKEINTVGDDETPFYKEGKLYFSSTGWPGLGGFDIFSSTWNGTSWSTPVNLGKGYNTSTDDMYFSVDKEGYTGFLVSNRPEGKSIKSKTCCDDIYYYTIEKYKAEVVTTVVDASSNKVVQGVDVQLIDMTGGKMGNTESKNSGKTNVTSFPLSLEKSYSLILTKEGYYPDTIRDINTVALTKSEVFNKKVNLRPKEPEYEIYSTEESIRLNNIYYDYDDDKILKDAEGDLSLIYDLMKQYPDMVIELGSHTDARGDDDYNLKLSQRRANSAKNWLLAKGIVASRINAVGYGETKILNKCTNGVECTDDEHRFNRRTEFKIVSGPTSIKIEKKRLKGTKDEGVIINNNPLLNAVKEAKKEPAPPANSPSKPATPSTPAKATTPTKPATPTPAPAVEPAKPAAPVKKMGKTADLLKFDINTHNYGVIPKGDKRAFTYYFTNISDDDVEIETATGPEGMTIDWTKSVIKPGQKAYVKAVVDSNKKEKGDDVEDNIKVKLVNQDPKTKTSVIYQLGYHFKIK